MQTDLIKSKSVIGAKWTIIMAIVGVIASYILNIILGRFAPEVLGTYSAIQIFIATINTFVLFGSFSIFANFLPKINLEQRKTQFIITYSSIVFLVMILFIGLITFSPFAFQYLFKQKVMATILYFLIALTPVFILFQLLQNVLYGLMEIKIASILGRLQLLGLLCISLFFIIFLKKSFNNDYFLILLISTFILNALGFIIALVIVVKKINLKFNFNFYLPKGFWMFAISIYAGSVCNYANLNLDRLFVLKLGNLNQLGLYQAIISIWMLIDFFPQLLLRVLVPMFSSYIALNKKEMIKKSYLMSERYCILVSIGICLFIISFSKQLLLIFGEMYAKNFSLLIILAIASSFATLSYANGPILISTEKNKERLFNGILKICIQLVLTILFIEKLGLVGIVVAKGISILIAQIIPAYVVVIKLPYDLKIPREFFLGILVTLLCSVIYCVIDSDRMLFSLILFMSTFLLFLLSAHYRFNDFKYLVTLISK